MTIKDTNVWILDFEDIRKILFNPIINRHFKIVLAYVVIGELDKIKSDQKKDQTTKDAAKRANLEIRHLQLMKHKSLEVQVCKVISLKKNYK